MSTRFPEAPGTVAAQPPPAANEAFEEPAARHEPLAFGQERLWFLDRLEPGSPLYNIPFALRLRGELDRAALRHALNEIVARHEVLRTNFRIREGVPTQLIHAVGSIGFVEIDLSSLPADQRETQAKAELAREARRPFDLASDSMLRATLCRMGTRDHILLLNVHHIAADEWSLKILLRELAENYCRFLSEETNSGPDLPIQYADFAFWQRDRLQGEFLNEQLSYWRQLFEGDIPVLELPLDHSRPKTPGHNGATASLPLPVELSRDLMELSRQEGVTLFMLLLTAFEALLHRYTRQEDLIVGTPVAGRTRIETEPLIGFFVNTLPLRTRVSSTMSFRELLERIRRLTLDAFAHQELPFEKLVAELQPRRQSSSTPLIQVMFAVETMDAELCALPNLEVELVPVETGTAKFDFTFVVQQTGESLVAIVEFNTALFERATIERLLRHYQTLLAGVVRNPNEIIGRLPLMSAAEREEVLVEWNQTETDYPKDSTLAELFERQVERSAESVAVEFGAERLTYAELNQQANFWAHQLRAAGAGPDVLVGLCADRSIAMVVGMLAIVKAGAAYLPLDPTYPRERLAFMLDDARAPILLVEPHLKSVLPATSAQIMELGRTPRGSAENLPINSSAANLAYAIYTSGSTGRPKGVLIPQRAVIRLVIATDYVRIDRSDRIAQASNPCFDAATFEIWGALLNGARLIGIPRDVMLSPKDFSRTLQEREITTLFLTTALFNQMACDAPEGFATLRHLLFGGEKVDPKWVRQVLTHSPPERLLHVYGPTESTTFASWYAVGGVKEAEATVPIGRPIANTQIYLLNETLEPVAAGLPGEIFIGGDGLALGYLNQPDLTAQKFVSNPFSADPTARLYRTGDLARYRIDGVIEFLGRIDQQVKVRGFRVELGEIEAVLKTHPGLRESVVVARRDDTTGTLRLVAYLVLEPDVSTGAIREFLKEKLPDYMIPSVLVPIAALPLNASGKVERERLPAPQLDLSASPARQAARNSVESELIEIWEQILNVRPIGTRDNFFELGGHSLLAIQLFAQIEKRFQRKLPLSTLFQSPSIEQIAELLREKASAPSSLLVGIQPHGSKLPIYWIHSLGGDGGGGFFYYRKLAELLGPEQPSFGIRSPAEPLKRIEEMAPRYIAEIRSFQPTGPYFLGGFCFGGNVAFEIARQLETQGQQVGLLVLLESAVPRFQSRDRSFSRTEYLRSFLLNFRYWWEDVSHQSARELLSRLRRKQAQLRKRLSRTLKVPGAASTALELADVLDMSGYPADYVKYAQAHWQALLAYQPQAYQGHVILFRARKQPLSHCDSTLGWGRLARGGVAVNIVPGTHEKMLEEPNVQILAAELKACLAEAQIGQSDVDLPEVESDPPPAASHTRPDVFSTVIT